MFHMTQLQKAIQNQSLKFLFNKKNYKVENNFFGQIDAFSYDYFFCKSGQGGSTMVDLNSVQARL